MRSFGRSEKILVASPALVAAYGQPQALADVEHMPTLAVGTAEKKHHWRFVGADSKSVELSHSPRLITDDHHTLRRAAIRGAGVACLPLLLVTEDLKSGTLLHLLPSLRS